MFPHWVGSQFLAKMVSCTFLEWIMLVIVTMVDVFLKLTLSWRVLRVYVIVGEHGSLGRGGWFHYWCGSR